MRAKGRGPRFVRVVSVTTAAAVGASVLVGIPALPGVTKVRPAAAATPAGTLCSGVQASGTFTSPEERDATVRYKLFVPQGSTVAFTGFLDEKASVDYIFWIKVVTSPGWSQGYEPGNPWSQSDQLNMSLGTRTWTNSGASREVEVHFYWSNNAAAGWLRWHVTATVSGNSATAPCKPVDPRNTLGPENCAGKHAMSRQPTAADPVNVATGNFFEDFTDLVVPGRGPGLALSHTYNSLQSGVDGPLGHGWTHSYAMSLVDDGPSATATVTQEGGATLPFTRLADGSYVAPAWAVATLARSADGSYTMKRCNRTTFRFSATGQLLSIADRNGYATTLAYTNGKLATVADAAARKLHLTWVGNRISEVRDETGRKVTFGYDAAGDLTDYTDAGGATWRFGYDGHRMTTVRRPNQAAAANPRLVTNVYDASNRVVSQTDELDRATLFDYSALSASGSGWVKVTDPKGNATRYELKGYALITRVDGYGSSTESTWRYQGDATLGVTRAVDPNGRITSASYDGNGNLTRLWTPLNHVTKATYDDLDQPLTVTDAAGVTTTYTYDGNGNLTAVETPLVGSTSVRRTTFGYDPLRPGDVTTVTDPKGKVWSRSYDPSTGYVTSEADPLGNRALFAHDERGWLTSEVSPRGTAAGVTAPCTPPAMGCTTYAHDGWGHVTVTTDANGARSTDHHDANGNLDSTTDAIGNRTRFVYDAADQLTAVERADGTTLVSRYWPDGSVKETLDGTGRATSYDYDAQGRLTATTDPDGRRTTYGYDPAGNVVSKADPGGACPAWATTWPPTLAPASGCTALAYDANDRLVAVRYSDGVTPNVASIGYDAVGRRTSRADGSGTSTWTWDSLGRLRTAKDGAAKTVTYTYANTRDPATTINYPGRGDVVRAFDDAGRMVSVRDWLGNETTFGADRDANVTSATSPGGVGLADAYSPLDNAGRLKGTQARANGATVASFTYGRDGAGQVTSVATTGALADSHTYAYTALNQLEKVDGAAVYGHDAADNLLRMPGVVLGGHSNANQVGTATRGTGATTFGHDNRGNRTSATRAVGASSTYGFDQANRLTSVDTTTHSPMLAAGWYHSLAAKANGQLQAWGYNASGQLGDGTTTNRTPPVTVPGMTGVVAVAAGAYQSAALRADGTVWTWGWNAVGQLGDGTTTDRTSPVQVPGLSGVVAIASGASHALALKADGTVWAWGYNSNGQLGDGTTTTRTSPVQVQGLAGVVAVAGGYVHSVALRSDGTVWSWGYNGFGQLGNNSTVDSAVPLQVPGLSGVAGIASGYNHVLAARSDGTVRAWGYNANGQLGTGTLANSAVPVHVQGLANAAQVSAAGYSSWALRADATVGAWGYNANGQLGDGTRTDRAVPVSVALSGARGLSPGPAHGLVLASDGTARAWGYNGVGALGNGSLTDSNSPVAVSGYARGSEPKASYAYDGDGLRTRKTVAGVVTAFTWDASADLPLLIDDGTNAYLYGPDGLPFEHIGPNNAVTWYHHDQLGSTRVLTNGSGAVTGTATYDPYGRLASSTGRLSPLGFAGEYTDAETGFVYLRARYYDPGTGQFISRDPLTAMTGSPYAYVDGNPLNWTDPTGLVKCQWCANLAGGVLDGLTLGHGDDVLRLLGQEGKVDWCSGESKAGRVVGIGILIAPLLARGRGSPTVPPPTSNIARTTQLAEEWLGPNVRVITNRSGDKIFLSQDGLRRIRFDINNPAPHSSPHAHVEELINGKWVKSGPIYPTDVPHR